MSAKQTINSTIYIQELCCPAEFKMVAKKLAQFNVGNIEPDYMARTIHFSHQEDQKKAIMKAIKKLNFNGKWVEDADTENKVDIHESYLVLAISFILAIASEAMAYAGVAVYWVAIPALIAILLCGIPVYKKGITALLNRQMSMAALMSIAVTGSFLIGHLSEAAMVMVLFSLSERLEAYSIAKANTAILSLVSLIPEKVKRKDEQGNWQTVDVQAVKVGDLIRAASGDKIALDGEITEGEGHFDESSITGESLPKHKGEQDKVYAGSINVDGSITYRALSESSNSTLAKLIQLVKKTQQTKSKTIRFIDQFARYYTPCIIAIAIVTAVALPIFSNATILQAVYQALVLLVIACPCALIISTPIVLIFANTIAAKNGIIIKSNHILESAHKIQSFSFDKTGTLTQGKPKIEQVHTFSDEAEVLAISASIAKYSNHPLAKIICEAYPEAHHANVADFKEIAGKGCQGKIAHEDYFFGSLAFIQEKIAVNPEMQSIVAAAQSQGKSIVCLASGQALKAIFVIQDAIKAEAKSVVDQLQQQGIYCQILSGDHQAAVSHIGGELAMDDAKGSLLPADKLSAIKQQGDKGMTAMIGDGINDAAALAKADISFAMHVLGADIAVETANVAILDDDLRKVTFLLALSKKCKRLLIENISLILLVKVGFILLTLFVFSSMWLAVLADVGLSLAVILNGLRIFKLDKKRARRKATA